MNRKASLSETSVQDLIRRARGGDQPSLEELFRRSQPRLDEWALQRLAKAQPGFSRPSDIVQDTSLRAVQKFSTFKGTTEGEWFTWLQKVFRSRTAQAFRDAGRKKRERRHAVPLDSATIEGTPALEKSPSQSAAYEEERRQLLKQLYLLPEEQGRAIWLCHWRELPVKEAAVQMGKTEAAVAGLIQRGLKAMHGRMAGESAAEPTAGDGGPAEGSDAAAALLAYLQRRDAGEHFDTDAWIEEHAGCAGELRSMLTWIERIEPARHAPPPVQPSKRSARRRQC